METCDKFKEWLDQLFGDPGDDSSDQIPETSPDAPEAWDSYPALRDTGGPRDFPQYTGNAREQFVQWMDDY